jgi:hypothetical protein
MNVDGRCHCGHIVYEAKIDPAKVRICHCTDCQTLSGSAFRTNALTEPDGFRLLSGELKTYVKIAESGAKRQQSFCPQCGTPIYATSDGAGPKVYGIRLGTIRQRGELVPRLQIWCGSAQPWVKHLDEIQRRDEALDRTARPGG